MAKIQTPVKGFTGTVAGVSFADGAGETTDPAALAYFARQGYTIEGAAETGEKPLTAKEKLQAEAKELGLDTEGTIAELQARIEEHKQSTESTGDGDAGKDSEGAAETGGDN